MHRRIVMVAAIVLAVIAVLALGAPWFASFDPNDTARARPPERPERRCT